MKERGQNLIGQREKDDSALNLVCRQAQEAILDPNVPDIYKDYVLNAAIDTIQQVAERKAQYYSKHGWGRLTRKK